jgi:hypothetical protein
VFQVEGELPKSRGTLFRTFDQKYEEIKGNPPISADSRRFKSELLQHLAFGMLAGDALEPQLRLTRTEAERRVEELLTGRVTAPGQMAKEWLEDLLEHHLLQVADDPKEIEFHHQMFLEYYAAEALLNRVERLEGEELKREFLNFLKWTEPLALMLALVKDEALAIQVVRLALKVDLMLGVRLAGEVKLEFQEETIGFVDALEVPDWLKIRLLGETRSKKAIAKLHQLLNYSYCYARGSEASVLSKIRNETAIPELLQRLEHSDFDVRERAADMLGEIGRETAIPGLLQRLEHSDSDVRERVASVLGKIRNEMTIPELLQRLEHSDSDVRERVADALGNIAKKQTETIAQHLPNLLTLILTNSGEAAHRVIRAIQENCKFYNYEVFQAHLEAQKLDRQTPPTSETEIANVTTIQAEKLTLMTDKAPIFNQQNATIGVNYAAEGSKQEFTQHINATEQNFEILLMGYKQFIDELQREHPKLTHETEIIKIIDVEAKRIDARWQNFLSLKRLWNGGKKAAVKVGEHFAESNPWYKGAIAFLEGISEDVK